MTKKKTKKKKMKEKKWVTLHLFSIDFANVKFVSWVDEEATQKAFAHRPIHDQTHVPSR